MTINKNDNDNNNMRKVSHCHTNLKNHLKGYLLIDVHMHRWTDRYLKREDVRGKSVALPVPG